MKITRPNAETKVTTFDSIQEMVSYIDNTPIIGPFSTCPESESTRDKEWYGTRNMSEARELLRTGWTDKSKELEEKLNTKLKKEATQVTRQKSVYDVIGGNASVPRYLQGVPTNMIRQVRKPVKEKVLTVNYCCSFSARVTAEEITNSAVECLSYVKHLEDSGTRVTVNVCWLIENPSYLEGKIQRAYVVPVKKSSERLSISKLAFALCHPSMLRRIMFACLERDLDAPANWTGSYGHPVRNKTTASEMIPNAEFFNLS